MTETIPEEFVDLFEKRAFADLATLMPDGSPQVTPVWCDYEDGRVVVNTAKGRQKDRNMRRDPRVTLSLMDPDDAYRYLEVRGRVDEITEEGADEKIDDLARKYLDVEEYPWKDPDEVRVTYLIEPFHSTHSE